MFIFTYYAAIMFTICSFVFMNTGQSFLLRELHGLTGGSLSRMAMSLVFADEVLSIALIGFWGYMSDIVGRRFIYSGGFVLVALGFALYPSASCVFPDSFGSFFTSLLFFRLIFSLGCSMVASLMVAFLSDFTTAESNERFSGLVGLFSCFGGLLGGVLFPVFPSCDGFYVLAACLFVLSGCIVAFVGDKRGKGKSSCRGCFFSREKILVALRAGKNPLIALSYFSAFAARSVTMINSTLLFPWIAAALRQRGLCPGEAGPGPACPLAKKTSIKHSGMIHTMALVMAPFYGHISSKYSALVSTMIAAAIYFVSDVCLVIVEHPRSLWQYLIMMGKGTGQIGLIVSGLSLASKNSPEDLRGTISGMYGFFGALGILVNSKLAGTLFESTVPTSPFILLSVWTSLLFSMSVFVFLYLKSGKPGRRQASGSDGANQIAPEAYDKPSV